MLVNLAVNFSGVLIFLFIFWKRLKEDYTGEIIFTSAFYILFGILVGFFIANKFFPSWFLWTAAIGGSLGLTFGIMRFKTRPYEVGEGFLVATLPWLSFIFLGDSVSNASLSSFLAFIAILIFVFLSYYFDVYYKSFTWYKSGKIGFTGLAILSLIFLTRLSIAIIGIDMLSFAGVYEIIASSLGVIISLLLLFNLGRQTE